MPTASSAPRCSPSISARPEHWRLPCPARRSMMTATHRIETIERLYSDQWVVVEVTRASRSRGPLAGRILAHSPDEQEITRAAVKAREERPTAQLWTF